MGKEKQVIMTYDEHQQWITDRALYQQDLAKFGDLLAEQEENMKKLIKERDDIVVIEMKRVMIQKDWKWKGNAFSNYRSYEDRYAYFPRFYGEDEVAKSLDAGHMEMFYAIKDLQADLEREKACRKHDRDGFEKMNKTIPINVWNALSDRWRERIRKVLHKTLKKLAKG